MKNLLVVAAVLAAAPAAMASKARVEALGGSRQLVDVQYTFERPYLLNTIGEQVTIEWGDADTGVTRAARHVEGGFFKKHNEMTYGVYLGRQGMLSTSVEATELAEQNPINLLFGMKTGEISWGVNLGYSNGKDDATELKANSTTLNLGAQFGQFEVEVGSTLSAKSEDAVNDTTTEIKGHFNLGVGYNINENMHAYATYETYKVAKATDAEHTNMEIGYINTFAKTDDANMFYGVAYSSDKVKDGVESQYLPVWIGVEASATSWMTLRASVRQNILINEDKAANGDKSDLDSIGFAAGAGVKLGKGMLDATFGTANQGHMSFSDGTGDQFLSNVSYTYNF